MKILLLEPDMLLGQIYMDAMKYAGNDVAWYKDAQSAIRGLDHQLPEIIVAEVQMAGHNGIEFLYELRSYNDWQNIPAMILSQVPPHESGIGPSMWDQLGVKAYHYKPFTTLSELVKSINQTLALA